MMPNNVTPPPEKIIQRIKANKKERRRTQSINHAFDELRKHIPDVPQDTKLSKIKTLRLAISYINHLMATLNGDEPIINNESNHSEVIIAIPTPQIPDDAKYRNKDRKHRTGWPEIIWNTSSSLKRLEAQQQQNSEQPPTNPEIQFKVDYSYNV